MSDRPAVHYHPGTKKQGQPEASQIVQKREDVLKTKKGSPRVLSSDLPPLSSDEEEHSDSNEETRDRQPESGPSASSHLRKATSSTPTTDPSARRALESQQQQQHPTQDRSGASPAPKVDAAPARVPKQPVSESGNSGKQETKQARETQTAKPTSTSK